MPYEPARTALPVETFTLASLRDRRGSRELGNHQRLQFEMLLYCTDGAGFHEVDFEPVSLAPGRILHVRTGQVHRWMLDEPYGARLVLLRPPHHRRGRSSGIHVIEPGTDASRDIRTIIDLLARDDRSTPLTIHGLEGVHQLVIELLDGNPFPRHDEGHRHRICADFERLISDVEPPPRTVQECASQLGYSTRTLTRACHAVADTSPKVLLDRAIALEAQRRLIDSGSTIAAVANALGFAELSNFTRFFRRLTGENPSGFVARVHHADRDV